MEALGSGERARSGAAQAVDRTARQLVRAVHGRHRAPPAEREDALLIALLAGFPDRVARRRKPHAPELVLSGGGSAVLDPVSVVQEPLLLLALDAEQRQGPRGPEVRVRVASAIEPEWLDLFPSGSPTRTGWSSPRVRPVERINRLAYGAVTSRSGARRRAVGADRGDPRRGHPGRGLGNVVDTERVDALGPA
jgi:ATP-dependent helicase HrpB